MLMQNYDYYEYIGGVLYDKGYLRSCKDMDLGALLQNVIYCNKVLTRLESAFYHNRLDLKN